MDHDAIRERIKQLRKTLKLNQQDFGSTIGLSADAVYNIEKGRAEPKELMLQLICTTYKVNESWLLHGEGEIFYTPTADEELATFVGEVLGESDDSFKKQLISALSQLTPEQWDVLADLANNLLDKKQKKDGA